MHNGIDPVSVTQILNVLIPAARKCSVEPADASVIAVFTGGESVSILVFFLFPFWAGVDLAAEPGTPVCAACAGTVIDVRDDDLMGATVVISHEDGYDTLYANLQSQPAVKVGDFVTAGQVLGSVGKTALGESAMAPHLHFAVTKDGEYVDPEEYLK